MKLLELDNEPLIRGVEYDLPVEGFGRVAVVAGGLLVVTFEDLTAAKLAIEAEEDRDYAAEVPAGELNYRAIADLTGKYALCTSARHPSGIVSVTKAVIGMSPENGTADREIVIGSSDQLEYLGGKIALLCGIQYNSSIAGRHLKVGASPDGVSITNLADATSTIVIPRVDAEMLGSGARN